MLVLAVPDLLRLVARVLLALGDRDGVVEVARLARDQSARLARGYAEGPLERIRDDMALADMWTQRGYQEIFLGLPPPVFTDAEVAVRLAEHVRHLRLRRPQRLSRPARSPVWRAWSLPRPVTGPLLSAGCARSARR